MQLPSSIFQTILEFPAYFRFRRERYQAFQQRQTDLWLPGWSVSKQAVGSRHFHSHASM